MDPVLQRFHPLVAAWFAEALGEPTGVQRAAWPAVARGGDVLVAAPTGAGKTLAAFLWAIDELVRAAEGDELSDRVRVVYVSPLRALGNDIQKNLAVPLAGIRERAARAGIELLAIRVAVRSGDTPARERELQARRPPHILITTPESLYLLLTSRRGREALRGAQTVVVHEIHAVAGDKRGSHLAFSLERLDEAAGRRVQRIGLSATQRPIEDIARLLVGAGRCNAAGRPECGIIDMGHRREIELSIEVPAGHELGPIATHELRDAVMDRIADLSREQRSTIVFVHTRRLVERVARALAERLGNDKVAAHHGSLSRELRLDAEEGLKSGRVPVVVASASLELGIDVGSVDLVCHIGAPRSVAQLLQRVGRSGHVRCAVPRGILFPLTRDDLLQCAAAVRAAYSGVLDAVEIPCAPLDILAQQVVATVAAAGAEGIGVEELWAMARRAWPWRGLDRAEFDAVLEMLVEGVSTRRGRRAALLRLDRVRGRLTPRRGARLAAITGGGAIPDTADYRVIEDATGTFVGTVNEDFAIESLSGDVFQLGNHSWRIRRVEAGQVRVSDAEGQPPTMPFWLGEAPARTPELSEAVSALREELARDAGDPAAVSRLAAGCRLDRAGAEQLVDYVRETVAVLGTVPLTRRIVVERFFDEAGGMQLVLHAPFGGRVNRALGLLLRKRFCVGFDFELQAAATDDGVVLSLGEQHSFPLESVFAMLRPAGAREALVQAVLRSPMFVNRWRWNATRALAVPRFSGGRKVPLPIQRMRAEDLMAAVFPAQLACGDNHAGPIEPPAHPLVDETIRNCLEEGTDFPRCVALLRAIERGEIETVAVETPAPSPMSHEILNANPYAFLDDAPLEERRARAVALRRTAPDLAAGIGALDAEAVAEVRREAWPRPRDVEETHDALCSLVLVPELEAAEWREWIDVLCAQGRACRAVADGAAWVVAAEAVPVARALAPGARFEPPPRPVRYPLSSERVPASRSEAATSVVRGWMECVGPTTAVALSERLALAPQLVAAALERLEGDGVVLRGCFEPGVAGEQWCERGLLARIHRRTLGRLRREIEPVTPVDFMRFLLRWQHAVPGARLHGRDGLREVLEQLEGVHVPGPAWERDVLPARVENYDPADLDALCLAGEIGWGRLVPPAEGSTEPGARRRTAPGRGTPLAFFRRDHIGELVVPEERDGGDPSQASLSAAARDVYEHLRRAGASFLPDLARALGRLPVEIEDALWELVAAGLVTGDGVAGLRVLLLPESERRARPARRRAGHLRPVAGGGRRRLMPVGRWALLRHSGVSPLPENEWDEAAARRLLRRYGVVTRDIVQRERQRPPWWRLVRVLRRMEARGEVRGGRFVAGLGGEQFALPTAVETLRAARRLGKDAETVVLSAADPLKLTGILGPGERIAATSGLYIVYRNGLPAEVGSLGEVRSRLASA